MPRYHFNLYDGREILDHEGTDLADLQAARDEALRFVGELLIYEGRCLALNRGCALIVKNECGLTQFRLDVTLDFETLFRFNIQSSSPQAEEVHADVEKWFTCK